MRSVWHTRAPWNHFIAPEPPHVTKITKISFNESSICLTGLHVFFLSVPDGASSTKPSWRPLTRKSVLVVVRADCFEFDLGFSQFALCGYGHNLFIISFSFQGKSGKVWDWGLRVFGFLF